MVVNDGEILEAAGMLSNPTTHISLGNSTLMEMKNIQQYVEQEWKTISEVPGVSHQMKMAEL